jgi:hypothetical protein
MSNEKDLLTEGAISPTEVCNLLLRHVFDQG